MIAHTYAGRKEVVWHVRAAESKLSFDVQFDFSICTFLRNESERMPIDTLFAQRARTIPPPLYGPAQPARPDLISLTYGFADPALFPSDDLLNATAEVLRHDAAEALNYGPAFAGLRGFVVERLRAQGIAASDEHVLLSYGSSQILALLPQVFVDPGDTVIIEGPTFMGAVRHFADSGARLLTVPTDRDGMQVDALEVMLRQLEREGVRPKFIYTIPTFHNPTGATMPLHRRRKLLELAAKHNVIIAEDDAYGDLRFGGVSLPSLAALDTNGMVIRIGTFSKILAPGVRTGWTCAHPAIIARLAAFKSEGANGPFLTRLVARFCAEGRLDTHIAALNELYRHKRDVMLAMIEREMPQVKVEKPEGGFFVWCQLPEGMSANALLQRAEAAGASFLPGGRCFANGTGDAYIRLAFSFQPAEQIEVAIRRIGRAMKQ